MPLGTLRAQLRSTFRSLQHRNYRLYWTGQLISLVGTWMQSVAQGWLMHRLTSSAFMLGFLGFAQFLPVLLLSLWAGVIVDSMDKRKLLLITQTAFLLQAALLATAVSTGIVQPWMVLALAFVFGTINAVDLPARQSFVVELAGKEDLSNAIALNSAAFNTARIVGPAIAGILLATVGEAGCFWLNAASYIAVIASIWRMDIAPRTGIRFQVERALENMKEGVRYAKSVRPLRNLLILLGFTAGMGFLAGFGLILYVATTNTLIQITTEDRYRGRMMSLYTLMFVGTAPIGALVSGSIAQRFGAPVATSVSAFVLLGGALWMMRRLRVLALREPAPPTPASAATEKVG